MAFPDGLEVDDEIFASIGTAGAIGEAFKSVSGNEHISGRNLLKRQRKR